MTISVGSTQSSRGSMTNSPTERESASLVIGRLWANQEHLVAEVTLLRAEIASLREPDIDGEPAPLGSNWVTIKEAANLSGYSPSALRKQRMSGKIKALNRGGSWKIDIMTVKSKSTICYSSRTAEPRVPSQNENITRKSLRSPRPATSPAR